MQAILAGAFSYITPHRIIIDSPRPPLFSSPLWFVDDRNTSRASTLMLAFVKQIGPNGMCNVDVRRHDFQDSQ
jgi:hypothetical protein